MTRALPQLIPATSEMPGWSSYAPRKYLSISALSNFARCPRKFFYDNGCRLRRPVEHPALVFGEALHRAFPIAISTGDVPAAFREFLAAWGDTVGDDKRNAGRALAMITDLAERHRSGRSIYSLVESPPPPPSLADVKRVSPWEVPWAVDIGLDVPLVGRIDALGVHRDSHARYVVEFKTASEVSARAIGGFTYSPQVLGYVLAARATGLDVRGCIVESVLVSKTTVGTLVHPIDVLDHQLEDFVTWARIVGENVLARETRRSFEKNPAGCYPYAMFGQQGFMCDYALLCHNVPNWTAFREHFIVRRDSPFELQGSTT